MKITIKVGEQRKEKQVEGYLSVKLQNKKLGIYRVNGGKERVRGGEKVIIAREREKKKDRPVQATRLLRPCLILTEVTFQLHRT